MLNRFKNNKKIIGILGIGVSGLAAFKYLKKKYAEICVYDDNKIPTDDLKKFWKHYSKWNWKDLEKIVISPGVPLYGKNKHPVIDLAKLHKISLINEIEFLFYKKPKAKIIGITGTNGKSTLVSLISHILKENNIPNVVCGNFGNPACLIKDPGEKGVIIIELSSYQLNSIPSLKVDFCSIINISSDHIDYHGSFDSYLNSKLRLLKAIDKKGVIIINKNEKFLEKKIYAFIQNNQIQSRIIYTEDSNLKSDYIFGKHNLELFEIAIKICKILRLSEINIKKAILKFRPLPHRMEIIFKHDKLIIINDSKATNGNSSSAALKTFKNIYWIAGGLKKKDGLGESLKYLINVRKIYLIGTSKNFFLNQLQSVNINIPINKFEKLEFAIDQILEDIKNNKNIEQTILFSPAAASFDEYENFEKRGKVFKKIILKKVESIK